MERITRAILAVAATEATGQTAAKAWPDDMPTDPRVVAALIGQAAVESGGFRHTEENLSYSAELLRRYFGFYQRNPELADAHAHKPALIANHAYADCNRPPEYALGNGPPETGDGWRFRGQGYPQLTGRGNFTAAGEALGLPLVEAPHLAQEPAISWRIFAWYFRDRTVTAAINGRTVRLILEEWAKRARWREVTEGINAASLHLAERIEATRTALAILRGGPSVRELQQALADAGFNPGPIDGVRGSKTEAAIDEAMTAPGWPEAALVLWLPTIKGGA